MILEVHEYNYILQLDLHSICIHIAKATTGITGFLHAVCGHNL